jgi:hypothetical protein
MNPSLVANNKKISEDVCARCSLKIYPLELQNTVVRDQKYHRVCFKCFVCDGPLLLTNYKTNQFDKSDKNVYCSAHVPTKVHVYKGFLPQRNQSISVDALSDATNQNEKKELEYCEHNHNQEVQSIPNQEHDSDHQELAKSQDIFIQDLDLDETFKQNEQDNIIKDSNKSHVFLIPEVNAHNTNEMLVMPPGSTDENQYIKELHETKAAPVIRNYAFLKHNSNTNQTAVNSERIICNQKMILGESSCLGAIKITLLYDELRNRLSVTIHEAENLKNLQNNPKTVSDPYCRIYLLPDDNQKSLKRRTKIIKVKNKNFKYLLQILNEKKLTIKNDLNPKWEETFDYSMSYEKTLSKHLLISLKDKDLTGMFKVFI